MIKSEVGRLEKNNITLIEYGDGTITYDDKVFLQIGIMGVYCSKKELKDLSTVINYYLNIDEITQCKVVIEGEKHGWMAI